jgi:hypothetical protein
MEIIGIDWGEIGGDHTAIAVRNSAEVYTVAFDAWTDEYVMAEVLELERLIRL